jgi:ABC-type polysaccharide/polyol phosphate export permease
VWPATHILTDGSALSRKPASIRSEGARTIAGPGRVRLWADIAEMVREPFEYRELLRAIIARDLALRYRNSVLGFGWAVAMPLLHMLIFTVVFTRIAPLRTDVPYPVFAYAGLLPWNLFAASQRFATLSLTANPELVTRVYFPREVLPLSAVLVASFDALVASSVLALLMVYFGIDVGWTLGFLPVVLAVQLSFTLGMAFILSMAALYYADVRYILELLLTVWMFATSVVYPLEGVGGRAGTLLALNPMTPIIDAYRAVLLRDELPATGPFLGAAAFSFAVLLVGWLWFHRLEFRFAEEL